MNKVIEINNYYGYSVSNQDTTGNLYYYKALSDTQRNMMEIPHVDSSGAL